MVEFFIFKSFLKLIREGQDGVRWLPTLFPSFYCKRKVDEVGWLQPHMQFGLKQGSKQLERVLQVGRKSVNIPVEIPPENTTDNRLQITKKDSIVGIFLWILGVFLNNCFIKHT